MLFNATANMASASVKLILTALEELNSLPNIFLAISITLLTILIPLAIAILTDVYQKRRDQKAEFTNLDLHVILDHIFKIKRLLISVALIFLPTLLWEISSGPFRLVETILSFTGIFFVAKTILDVYYWIKGNVFKFRFSYLRNLKNCDDMETVWRSVWEAENINIQNERQFFRVFSSTVDQLSKTDKESKTISKLLNDFANFINNRSIMFLGVRKVVFPKILQWHSKVWHKERAYSKQKKLERWSVYDEVLRALDSIIKRITERVLKKRESYSFFRHLKSHSDIHKNEEEYLTHLFTIFYHVYFENVESSPARYNIWKRCFPLEWKITKSNLQDENNYISAMSLYQFLPWAQERIWKSEEELDKKLNEISNNLFPEVDPIIWSKVLIFRFSPHDPNNRIKSVIERPWNFGQVGRAKMYWGHPEGSQPQMMKSQRESELRNTFELAIMLFKDTFSKESLESYIKNLEEMKYEEDSSEEKKRLILLDIFTKMSNFLGQ